METGNGNVRLDVGKAHDASGVSADGRFGCLWIWDLGSGVNRIRCEWCVHGEKGITIEE